MFYVKYDNVHVTIAQNDVIKKLTYSKNVFNHPKKDANYNDMQQWRVSICLLAITGIFA